MAPLRAYGVQPREEVPKAPEEATAERVHVPCEVCAMDFYSDTEVDVHREVEHGAELAHAARRGRSCPVCARRYPSSAARARHVRARHLLAGGAPRVPHALYACAVCGLLYFNRALLLYHLRLRHDFLSRDHKVECAYCGRATLVASHMAHIDNMHVRSVRACPLCLRAPAAAPHRHRAHACPHCKHAARTRGALDRHLDDAHGRRSTGGARCPPARLAQLFVRGRARRPPRYRAAFPERGVDLGGALAVCVLCQQICETREEERRHIESAHGHNVLPAPPPAPPAPPRRRCAACPAAFSTDVLLKQHALREHSARGRERDCTERERHGTQREQDGIKREWNGIERERDGIVRERDGIKREWDGIERERDGTERERNGIVRERDGVKREWDGIERERDGIKREWDGIERERDGTEREQGGIEREWDGIERERDGNERERDGTDRERDGTEREREGTVNLGELWTEESLPTVLWEVEVGVNGDVQCPWDLTGDD